MGSSVVSTDQVSSNHIEELKEKEEKSIRIGKKEKVEGRKAGA